MLRTLSAAVCAVLVLSASARATDQDTFDKLVAKAEKLAPSTVTLTAQFKPKRACFCLSDSLFGVVATNPLKGAGPIGCAAPVFDGNGSIVTFSFCAGDFV